MREMKVKVLVQQIMKGSENIKENMDHVWRNLEYIEETYEQMFLKTHRIQVRTQNRNLCINNRGEGKRNAIFLIVNPGQQGLPGRPNWGGLSRGEAPGDLSVRYRPAKREARPGEGGEAAGGGEEEREGERGGEEGGAEESC